MITVKQLKEFLEQFPEDQDILVRHKEGFYQTARDVAYVDTQLETGERQPSPVLIL